MAFFGGPVTYKLTFWGRNGGGGSSSPFYLNQGKIWLTMGGKKRRCTGRNGKIERWRERQEKEPSTQKKNEWE